MFGMYPYSWRFAWVFSRVPSQIKIRYDCRCNDIGIDHLVLSIFVMMNSLQHIVHKQKNYNLADYAVLRFGSWFHTHFYIGFHMDYHLLSSLSGNLG